MPLGPRVNEDFIEATSLLTWALGILMFESVAIIRGACSEESATDNKEE